VGSYGDGNGRQHRNGGSSSPAGLYNDDIGGQHWKNGGPLWRVGSPHQCKLVTMSPPVATFLAAPYRARDPLSSPSECNCCPRGCTPSASVQSTASTTEDPGLEREHTHRCSPSMAKDPGPGQDCASDEVWVLSGDGSDGS
jgi:hypothetical protein